jgi:hypothetical protein
VHYDLPRLLILLALAALLAGAVWVYSRYRVFNANAHNAEKSARPKTIRRAADRMRKPPRKKRRQ